MPPVIPGFSQFFLSDHSMGSWTNRWSLEFSFGAFSYQRIFGNVLRQNGRCKMDPPETSGTNLP
uniref:Uncharacterized protein n=1 Tax=Lepeophtheirus salmonis TaxID=72036 RepID=A0A0K2TYC2_LEPSM